MTFTIIETFDECTITVGGFNEEEDRDKAFNRYFVESKRNGFKGVQE